jgi:hypothetical protein
MTRLRTQVDCRAAHMPIAMLGISWQLINKIAFGLI